MSGEVRRLPVHLFDRHAGEIWIATGGNARFPEDWRFAYQASYVAAGGPALSVSLPLGHAQHSGAAVRNWFANLLPEGAAREAIAARLRIPVDDVYALLQALGGECAGAVAIGPTVSLGVGEGAERPLSLDEALCDLEGAPWALLGGPLRLSLAGAQDKLAVVRDADGLRLPRIGEASTHILKPESGHLRGMVDGEWFGLSLARAMGVPVATAELVHLGGKRALLVERFDRIREGGQHVRLHQEDFCQAFGYPPELKYQAQGGPALRDCVSVVRDRLRLDASGVSAVIDWVIASVLIGNADAHAKNLGLLRWPSGKIGITPIYDLVPTIAWSARVIDRRPAMSIGGAPAIDQVERRHWDGFARECGFPPAAVCERVRALANMGSAALPEVIEVLVSGGADREWLERAGGRVKTNIERCLATMGAEQGPANGPPDESASDPAP